VPAIKVNSTHETGLRINDGGLLAPAQTSLLIDQYELAMAAS
jgi:hypothetical protein